MKRIENKIFVVVAIFLLATGIAAAIPIDKKETLGPYGQGHKYYVHVYNVDDIATAAVNGKVVVTEKFQGDSGWVDITDKMQQGKNIIEFDLVNTIIGYSYGFEIRQDDSNIIFKDECGFAGFHACFNDDTSGQVYHNVITIIGAGVHTDTGKGKGPNRF